MDWKKKLASSSHDFQIAKYMLIDEAAVARKESRLAESDYQELLAKVFVPAMDQFQKELNRRGTLCESYAGKDSVSLTIGEGVKMRQSAKFVFAVSGRRMDQTVQTDILSGTWRFDTKAGKITIDDVLNYLAEFYMGARPIGSFESDFEP